MEQNEVILQVGAEGGHLTLYGIRTTYGWLFSRQVIDQTPDLFNEPWIQHNSEIVNLWSDALKLLDRYPWHKLYPLEVHSEFREMVFDAVVVRYKSENDINPRGLADWKKLCGISNEEELI